jgi:O-antigen ligase
LIGLIGIAILVPRRAVLDNTQAIGAYLKRMAGVFGAITVSGLAFLGLLLTLNNLLPAVLRRDLPAFLTASVLVGALYVSPAFVVTLAALIALWIVIYNRPLIGLALIIFWAPFFSLPADLYYWATPMVELCLLLTASAMLARRLLRRQPVAKGQTNRWQLTDWAMLALVLVAVLSLTWSAQLVPALRELRIIVVEPALFYLLLRAVGPSRQDLVRLVDVFILAGAAVSGIGLVEYLSGGSTGIAVAEQGARRLMSVYTSPNNLALFLGRCIPFGFAMTLVAPGTLRRVVAGIMTLLMLAALLLSQSIGAILLGLPAGLAVVLLLWNWRRGALAIGALIVILVAALALSRFIPRLQGAFDLSRSSSFVRTQLWTSAFNLLRERPLTGAGLDQFLYLYRSRYILPEAWAEPNLSHPHNFFLDYWISLGILGVSILAALQVAFWRRGWQVWRRSDRLVKALVIGAMGSMADFLAHGLVDNSYFVVDLAYIFCFSLALIVWLNSRSSENHAGSDQ